MLTHCVAVDHMGRARKTRKGDGAGVEKGAKRQKLQQTLGDSSAALLSAASPLSTAPTDEDMFGDLLRDEPMGLNPCSDSIDDFIDGAGTDAAGARSFTMLGNSATPHAWSFG